MWGLDQLANFGSRLPTFMAACSAAAKLFHIIERKPCACRVPHAAGPLPCLCCSFLRGVAGPNTVAAACPPRELS
jgi:hypothetical protein